MAFFDFRKTGTVEFLVNDLIKLNEKSIKSAMNKVGLDFKKETRRLIKEPPKTGRLYRIKGRIHRASAPGQSPANLTGNLRDKVAFKAIGFKKIEFGDKAKYAKFLEFGTVKMKKRPFILRTIDENGHRVIKHFNDALKRNLTQ